MSNNVSLCRASRTVEELSVLDLRKKQERQRTARLEADNRELKEATFAPNLTKKAQTAKVGLYVMFR